MGTRNLDKLDNKLLALKAEQLSIKKAMAKERKRRDEASIRSLGLMAFNAGLAEWDQAELREVMNAVSSHGPSPVLAQSIHALPKDKASQSVSE